MFPGGQPPQKPQMAVDNSSMVQQNLLYNIAFQQQIVNALSAFQQQQQQQQNQQAVCIAPLIRFPTAATSNYSSPSKYSFS